MKVLLSMLFLTQLSLIDAADFKCANGRKIYPKHFYINGSDRPLKIYVSNRTSHALISNIVKILLNEYVGYPKVDIVNLPHREDDIKIFQSITNCDTPSNCSSNEAEPDIMINLEAWITPGTSLEPWFLTKRVETCGPLGPIGRSGWFIADYIVNYFWMSNNTIVDHWKAFQNQAVVKEFIDIVQENVTSYKSLCTYKECGDDGIYRPDLCLKKTNRCATLFADFPELTFQLLKSTISKLGLYVNVVWIGDRLDDFIESGTRAAQRIIFYHSKMIYLTSFAKFTQITFPYDSSETRQLEVKQLEKIIWPQIQAHATHAYFFLKGIYFTQSEYEELVLDYIHKKRRGFTIEKCACDWVRDTIVWENWIHNENENKQILHIAGIFPINGTYWTQSGVVEAAEMAIEAINKNKTLLSNYELKLEVQDGQCAPDAVVRSFIRYVTSPIYKTMVGILGPACSDTVETFASLLHHFNIIALSYSAEGTLNKDKYPYFFRTIPENSIFIYVYMEFFKKLHYSTVAALTEEGQKYPEYISHLEADMQKAGMSPIINKKFPRERESLNLEPYLRDLMNKNVQIIIGDFYDYAARVALCDAYHLKMTAEYGYIWFLPPWLMSNWFDIDNLPKNTYDKINCTTKQMLSAINGYMSLSYKFFADDKSIMQEGKTVESWRKEYKEHSKRKNLSTSQYGGYAYDAVWMLALALENLFKENESHIASMHSPKTSRRLVELLNNTDMNGVSGHLSFSGTNRLSDVEILHWCNKTVSVIGVYHAETLTKGVLDLNESNIIWCTPDGLRPRGDQSNSNTFCKIEAFSKFLNVSCDIAYLILSAVALLILITLSAGTAVLTYKRRYEKRMKDTEQRMKELGLISKTNQFTPDNWEMPRDRIIINRKLGEGAFGAVYGGEAKVQNNGWISVAVKTLKNGAKSEEKLDFLSEAEIMKQFDHVNIVKLVGVCTMGEPVYTVMEFMLYGDLKTYLLSRRSLAMGKDRLDNDEVSDKRLTNMGLDIARGLSYLADKKYVHRDLACRNCLVNISRSVKIADFGMCRAMYDSDYYRYNKKGLLPVRWMAPESLIDGLFTPMSDVWSYGVVLYEIITFASLPYQGLSNSETLEYIKSHKTLSVPKGSKSELNSLLMRCWSLYPQERPQACEIVEILAQNSELISPCFEMPIPIIEGIDSGTLEIGMRDRNRGHSFSTTHQMNKSSLDLIQHEFAESLNISNQDNSALKYQGRKFKKSFHESIKKKSKKDGRKDKYVEFPQITYL